VVHTERPRFIAIFEEQPSRAPEDTAAEPRIEYWHTVLRDVDWIDAEPGQDESGALISEAAESLDTFLAPYPI
jgi:hypothetical protein